MRGPLFFELTSHAMQGRPHAGLLRDRLVTPWVDAAAEAWAARGVPAEAALTIDMRAVQRRPPSAGVS